MQTAYLMKVSSDQNNNKFYKMEQIDGSNFKATYGRVGSSGASNNYSMFLWDSKYREKLKGGYSDVTEKMATSVKTDAKLPGIATIDTLLLRLLSSSRQSFERTYTISASAITQAQVAEVQRIINRITNKSKIETDVSLFTRDFEELWHVLPRNVGRSVKDALPKSMTQIGDMIAREQDNIDNANVQQEFVSTEDEFLLDKLGIQIHEPIDRINLPQDVHSLIGTDLNRVGRIYPLSKPSIEQRFADNLAQAVDKTTKLRFHGTRFQNGMAILSTGLKILGSKAATYSGSMLGDAIYTSQAFQKSRNYSDGLMLILDVHTGRELNVTSSNMVKNYSFDELQRLGYDSVNMNAGTNSGWGALNYHEQTIYNEAQHKFAYLLEVE